MNKTAPNIIPDSDFLFESMPIGLLEEDYSPAKKMLDRIGFETETELRVYFARNPNFVIDCILSTTITRINKVGMETYGVSSLEEYEKDHREVTHWMDKDWVEFYGDELEALYFGKLPFEREFRDTQEDDTIVYVRNKSILLPGHERDWSRFLTLMENVSERWKLFQKMLGTQVTEEMKRKKDLYQVMVDTISNEPY